MDARVRTCELMYGHTYVHGFVRGYVDACAITCMHFMHVQILSIITVYDGNDDDDDDWQCVRACVR